MEQGRVYNKKQMLYNRLYSVAGMMRREGVPKQLRREHANLCWAIMLFLQIEEKQIKKLYAHHLEIGELGRD